MSSNVSPVTYHYEVGIKLDYFILSANVAILGWTIVNTDWLPKGIIFIWLMGTVWTLIILSLICGLIRQLYNGITFGLNQQYLDAAKMASTIERSALQGGSFTDQVTGKVISSQEFKKIALNHRSTEKKARELYKEYVNRSVMFANLTTIFMITSLSLLALVKIYALLSIKT